MNGKLKYCLIVLTLSLLTIFVILSQMESETIYDIHQGIMGGFSSNQWIHNVISQYKCPLFFVGNHTKLDVVAANSWKYSDKFFFENMDFDSDRCRSIKQTFDFNMKAFSKEEQEYPLAYGMIVYKNAAQTYLTLSAFYHPQNIYCIVVDGKSDVNFKKRIRELGKCFPNVNVIEHEPIEWCEKNVLHAQYTCFRDLTMQDHPWKYYQYITGFDLPAKTNLEMVRIFKQLNGTVVSEATIGGQIGLDSKKWKDAPFKVWKASMAAAVSRRAADDLFKVEKNYNQLKKLMKHLLSKGYIYSTCNDELFWASVFGNKKAFNVIGSFEARDLLKAKFEKWKMPKNYTTSEEDPYILYDSNVARFQLWQSKCKGAMRHGSCAFGIGDLPSLIYRHELIYHKFHMDVEPIAYFCLWKRIKDLSKGVKQLKFRGNFYKLLPQVRLFHGKSLKEAMKIPSQHDFLENKAKNNVT